MKFCLNTGILGSYSIERTEKIAPGTTGMILRHHTLNYVIPLDILPLSCIIDQFKTISL